MFQQFTAFFLSLILFLFGFTAKSIPEEKPFSEIEGLTDICKDYAISDTVYVLEAGTFRSPEERNMAVALQGIVAKTSPAIFIVTNSVDRALLSEIENSGHTLSYTDANGERWTLEKLLGKFSHLIADGGYTLYKVSYKAEGLNMATNLAAVKGWLPVPEDLEEMAVNAGLSKKEDFTDDIYNVLFQWSFFSRYKKDFSGGAVCSLRYEPSGLRDLAIQQGFFVFYIDDDEDGTLFRKRVIEYFGDNTPVLGWAKYEVKFVDQASKSGNMVIPSDHSYNLSFYSSLRCDIPQQKTVKNTYTDPTKHYAALVMSDGDNIQWIQNGYREYYEKLSLKNNFPVTWSFAPLLEEFAPAVVKKIYSDASERDYFMAGVSGAGYMHPTQYPKDVMAEYTDLTAAAMMKSDMEYVQILDSTPKTDADELLLINRLGYYSRYTNIKGGILSLDPSRYEGGQGRIWFSDDKPFITYRLSLWHPSGDMSQVTKEWIKEQADKINSYPADINSINGYSVINIHPWTISIENLSYFVSCLDEDVVLCTADELLSMITENIPHKSEAPH